MGFEMMMATAVALGFVTVTSLHWPSVAVSGPRRVVCSMNQGMHLIDTQIQQFWRQVSVH